MAFSAIRYPPYLHAKPSLLWNVVLPCVLVLQGIQALAFCSDPSQTHLTQMKIFFLGVVFHLLPLVLDVSLDSLFGSQITAILE